MGRMTLPRLTWLLLLCAAASLPVSADIYRWTDADGRIHFGDRAPPTGAAVEQIEAPAARARHPIPSCNAIASRAASCSRCGMPSAAIATRRLAAAAVAAAERDQACAQLRTELERSRQAAYLVRKSADGARGILSGAEREQYERGIADALAAHCR